MAAKMAANASQIGRLQAILRAWTSATNLTSASDADKVFETYILIKVAQGVEAAAIAKHGPKGTRIEILDCNVLPVGTLVVRGSPGTLSSTLIKGAAAPASFIRLTFGGDSIEFHQSVRWLDGVGVAHEADVAVMKPLPDKRDYKRGSPQFSSFILTVECKYWTSKPSISVGREVECFGYYIRTERHVLVTNQPMSKSINKFLSATTGRKDNYRFNVCDDAAPETVTCINNLVGYICSECGF